VTAKPLKLGLHEALLTRGLEALLSDLDEAAIIAEVPELRDAEASDRISRHLAGIVARAIERLPEGTRSSEAVRMAAALIHRLKELTDGTFDLDVDEPVDPGRVLVALAPASAGWPGPGHRAAADAAPRHHRVHERTGRTGGRSRAPG